MTWLLRLTGMTGINAESRFDISKLSYSANPVPSFSLEVGYVKKNSIAELTPGSYFYSSGTLTIKPTVNDDAKMIIGTGDNEKISASAGWNVNNSVQAGAVGATSISVA